jgi:DNA replication protein DnaC
MVFPMREMPTRAATCDVHGAYDSVNFVGTRWSGCPKCASALVEAEKKREHEQLRQERQDARLRHSGIEGRFAECSFDGFTAATEAQRKVLETCKGFAATVQWKGGAGLWLIGPPGTGKTHLGSAMVRHVIEERDAEAAIFSGREIIRKLRATWGQRGARDYEGEATTEEQLIADLGYMPLLVIDEIGVNFGTDAEHVQLFDVIDLRYKHQRPTVLLSNLSAKEIKAAIGERAYDRLREGAQMVVCDWPSHRGRPPAAKPGLEVVR